MTNKPQALDELLPCPFCGTVPERLRNLDNSLSDAFWHPDATCILSSCGLQRSKWEGWNTRAAHSLMAAKVAELEEETVDRIAESIGRAFEQWFSDKGRVSGDELDLRPAIRAALAPHPEGTDQ